MKRHMNKAERMIIERELNAGTSLKQIGRKLNRHTSTITSEIRGRLQISRKGCFGHSFNNCRNRFGCTLQNVCPKEGCHKKCFTCASCGTYCSEYERQDCPDLERAPYVCNACSRRSGCTLEKRFYRAGDAQQEYEQILSDARKGTHVSADEMQFIDDLVSPLLQSGQAPYVVWKAQQDQIMHSLSWLYRQIHDGALKASPMDLPATVQRRMRKPPKDKLPRPYKVDKACLEGRRFEDYKARILREPVYPTAQMDTVVGRIGGKPILTLYLREAHFMFAFLLKRGDARSVEKAMNLLYRKLHAKYFRLLFPVILTDNGSEFSNPEALEKTAGGVKRTEIYYCHPYSSFEKGAIENNHSLLRRILPKGTSFDDLTQGDLDIIMSHLNSYPRRKGNHATPFELLLNMFPDLGPALDRLQLHPVPIRQVEMKPGLVKKLMAQR